MSALIQAGEDTARRLSDEWLALDVGLANVDARRSISGSGMSTGAMGQWSGTWRAVRDNGTAGPRDRGTAVAVSQLIDMLVKNL